VKGLLAFLSRHRTKLSGYALVGLSAAQVNLVALAPVLSPAAFGWATMAIGLCVALIGHANSRKA
jgi:hypothetical protein